MRYSQLPTRLKLIALAVFFGLVGLWALAWSGLVGFLSPNDTAILVLAGMSFCAGVLVGGADMERWLIKTGQLPEPPRTDEYYRIEKRQRNIFIAGVLLISSVVLLVGLTEGWTTNDDAEANAAALAAGPSPY